MAAAQETPESWRNNRRTIRRDEKSNVPNPLLHLVQHTVNILNDFFGILHRRKLV